MDLIYLKFKKSEWRLWTLMEAHIALCNFSLKVSNLSIFIFLLSLYAITLLFY